MATAKQEIVTKQNGELQNRTAQLSTSERFTNKVMQEFSGSVAGAVQVTDYQRSLIQGYFIIIDRALKSAEEERVRKNSSNRDHQYDNQLPVNWNTVNMNDLALDLVHYARMGLDMMQDNMLFPIPYKNNKRGCYDVTLMEGYNGIRYIAEKYAVEAPSAVTIEVVYSTDTFKPIKKSKDNRIENYEFEINNAFDRGDIIGGFAYLEFSDPTRNELVIMPMKDILKRKPKYASANFWGGKQTVWENGKKIEVENEGWLDEMVRKTIIREAFSAKHLPRDPKKVDDNYQYMKMREARYAEIEAQQEINANANTVIIDTTVSTPAAALQESSTPQAENVDLGTGEVTTAGTAATEAVDEPDF
ncbi:MAG: recombinase RecT [Ruminococcus sp.]|nr:recombinase RecT [Ruminococcus sp.]